MQKDLIWKRVASTFDMAQPHLPGEKKSRSETSETLNFRLPSFELASDDPNRRTGQGSTESLL